MAGNAVHCDERVNGRYEIQRSAQEMIRCARAGESLQ